MEQDWEHKSLTNEVESAKRDTYVQSNKHTDEKPGEVRQKEEDREETKEIEHDKRGS